MEVLDIIADAVATLIESVLYTLILNAYWKYESKNKYLVSCAITTLFFMMGSFLSDYPVFQIIIYPVVMVLYSICILKAGFRQAVVISMVLMVNTILVDLSTILFVEVFVPYKNMEQVLETGVSKMVCLGLNRIIFVMVFYIWLHALIKKRMIKKEEWTMLAVYFAADMIIAATLISWTVMRHFDRQDYIYVFLIEGPIIVMTFVSLAMANQISHKNAYEKQNELVNLKLQAQRDDIMRLNKEYNDIRKVRHDMVKHLTIYMRLLNDGNYEALKKAIGEHIEDCGKSKFVYIADNNLINSVINEKAELCSRKNMEFEVKAAAAVDEAIELDIAVMLSNLLDNAIEAQNKLASDCRKYISLNIFSYQKKYCVLVKNTIARSVLLNNPEFRTDKQNEQIHGIGMKSIEETIQKNGGYIEKYEENGLFCVHIMI